MRDQATHTALTPGEMTEVNLIGAEVFSVDDARIGTVSQIHSRGPATQAIIDVGGFLGIGAKPVAMTVARLSFMHADDSAVYATSNWTKDQVRAFPERQG